MKGRVDGWSRACRLRDSDLVAAKRNRARLPVAMGLPMLVGVMILVHLRKTAMPTEMPSLGSETTIKAQLPGTLKGEVFQCDRSQFRTDICNMRGDIRLENNHTTGPTIALYAQEPATTVGKETVKPYTRKWETSCMDTIHQITLRSVPAASKHALTPRACDVHHKVPAVVFSTGGYTGNVYHEFHDGLIPLFITTQHLKREVVLVVSELHKWWLTKYEAVIKQITKFPVIDLERGTHVHCFPEVEAGLHIHAELGVDPDQMPHQESIRDFRNMLERAYNQPQHTDSKSQALKQLKPGGGHGKPRLTIVVRKSTRRLLNLDEIVKVSEQLGFNVTLLVPKSTTELKRVYRLLDNTDVLLGVHGAALTHFLFMRPGTVFIQIIPLGTDWAAFTYYGEPATKLGLHYLPYKIEPSESSLSEKYDSSDAILKDPDSIVKQGWWTMKKIYLEGQNVRPSIDHLRKVLKEALRKIGQHSQQTPSSPVSIRRAQKIGHHSQPERVS